MRYGSDKSRVQSEPTEEHIRGVKQGRGKALTQVRIVVREVGRKKPDYSLDFDLPEIPKIGSYISIRRPDTPEGYDDEDLIVRQVWWRLDHPETGTVASPDAKIGGIREILVECDPALGPWARDRWRELMERAKQRGGEVEDFDVLRLNVRQDALEPKKDN